MKLTTKNLWQPSQMGCVKVSFFSLYKNDPKTISDVLYKATKYMNAEDTLLAWEEKLKKRERQEDTW